jgi:hypothetical protein
MKNLYFIEIKSESGGRLVNGTNPGVDGLQDHKRKVEVMNTVHSNIKDDMQICIINFLLFLS